MTDLPVKNVGSQVRSDPPRRRVYCLCADWCGVCRQYRPVFDAFARNHPDVEFRWVDVEDEEEAMGDYEVETFPSLLIAEGGEARFLGPVLPQAGMIETLLQRLAQDGVQAADASAQELLERFVGALK